MRRDCRIVVALPNAISGVLTLGWSWNPIHADTNASATAGVIRKSTSKLKKVGFVESWLVRLIVAAAQCWRAAKPHHPYRGLDWIALLQGKSTGRNCPCIIFPQPAQLLHIVSALFAKESCPHKHRQRVALPTDRIAVIDVTRSGLVLLAVVHQ